MRAQQLVNNYRATYDAVYISKYQLLLEELGKTKRGMITKKLETLVSSAKKIGVSAKISGAGYGDCGIAQVSDSEKVNTLTKMWHNERIKVLNIWRKDQ